MKQKVIKFFQNLPEEKTEQFNEAFSLYRQSDGKNASAERSYNASGYSPHTLNNLLYDLQKIHGISDVEKVAVLEVVNNQYTDSGRIPQYLVGMEYSELVEWVKKMDEKEIDSWKLILEKAITEDEIYVAEIINSEFEKIVNRITEIPAELLLFSEDELRVWAKEKSIEKFYQIEQVWVLAVEAKNELISNVLLNEMNIIQYGPSPLLEALGVPNPTDFLIKEAGGLENKIEELHADKEILEFEKEDLENENEDLKGENEGLKTENEALKDLPVITNQSLRDEFPFLNNLDCPDEFKILVADKITAWNTYLESQSAISKADSGELVLTAEALADVAEIATRNFAENQRIYDELNVYKETGKVLGVHPIFKKLQFEREIELMTNAELIAYRGSSAKYFTDNKKGLEKAKKAKNEAKILEIETRVAERSEKLFLVNKKLGV